MYFRILLPFLLLISATSYSQTYSLKYIDTKTNASFRGLSVADEHAIWVSGSKGWVGRSTNGGKDWKFLQVAGYESCDFRTLHAFDADNAIIANTGSPAYILRTTDGGISWAQVYKNSDTAAFIDGIGFWNKRCGMVHGDPINGHMLLLYTTNRGKTWKQRRNSPQMKPGQASFAASGTSISCFLHGAVVVAAGGKVSELYFSRSRGRHWRSIPTPMLAGGESTGIYSFMMAGSAWRWMVAGGDYKRDTLRTANFFYTRDKGKTWLAPNTTTFGYRECLAQIADMPATRIDGPLTTFALGPTGIDISNDYGVTWKLLSDEKGFHVMKPSTDNKVMFLAGSNGKLAIMNNN